MKLYSGILSFSIIAILLMAETFATLPSATPSTTPTPIATSPVDPAFPPVPIPSVAIREDNLQQVTELARWGKGHLYTAEFSPDGQWIVVGASTGILLYDAETLQENKYIDTSCTVAELAFISDEILAILCNRRFVQVWNLNTGALLHALDTSPAIDLWGLKSGKGKLLVGADDDSTIWYVLWDTDSWTPTRFTLSFDLQSKLSISSDGKWIAGLIAEKDERKIWVWESNKNPEEVTQKIEIQRIESVGFFGFSVEEHLISETFLWDIVQNKPLYNWANSSRVTFATSSPDGTLVATLLVNQTIQIWDTRENKLVHILPFRGSIDTGILGYINPRDWYCRCQLNFSTDGRLLLAVVGDQAWVWRLEDEGLLGIIKPVTAYMIDAVDDRIVLSIGERVACCYSDRSSPSEIQVRRVSNGEVLYSVKVPSINSDTITTISPDGKWFASNFGEMPQAISVVSLPDGKTIWSFDHEKVLNGLVFSSNGAFLAAKLYDPNGGGGAQVWRLEDGKLLISCGGISNITFSYDSLLFFGCNALWRTSDGKLLYRVEGGYSQASIYADGSKTITVSGGYRNYGFYTDLALINNVDGKVMESARLNNSYETVSISPIDPTLVFLGGPWYWSPIEIWSTTEKRIIAALAGHSSYSIGFIPDGRLLVTSGDDGTIRFWGIKP
ncbi:MAG: WD40 repeat domain-containing protein [Nanoarchaeota archaeon]|nr:WD40 repeat domain-containing protein [Nanoarchaeota archaeon]